MARLFDISSELFELYNMSTDSEADEQALLELFNELEMQLEDKADGVALVIAKLNADADFLKTEESRLNARRKSIEGNAVRLKEQLQNAIHASGQDKIKTAKYTFFDKTTKSVNVIDESKLPKEYITIEEVTKIDKKMIGDALKGGAIINGAELVEKTSLNIR